MPHGRFTISFRRSTKLQKYETIRPYLRSSGPFHVLFFHPTKKWKQAWVRISNSSTNSYLKMKRQRRPRCIGTRLRACPETFWFRYRWDLRACPGVLYHLQEEQQHISGVRSKNNIFTWELPSLCLWQISWRGKRAGSYSQFFRFLFNLKMISL